MTTPTARNPRAEASALLGEGREARVLEPSPPADGSDGRYLADDPTDPAGASGTVVSPISDGDVSWATIAAGDDAVAAYARAHWLGPFPPLRPLPPRYAATRASVHRLAFFAIAPARYAVTGKLGLRMTHGGLGTPFHRTDGVDEQIRLEGPALVVQRGDDVRATVPRSVTDACAFLGHDYRSQWFADFHDPLEPTDPDGPLTLDGSSLGVLADWFAFGTLVLEELRRTDGAVDVSRVQLWPEHLDPAVELGSAEHGRRASYGASPGDEAHPEPYLYVSPWGDTPAGDFWSAEGFGGAVIGYPALRAAEDPVSTALSFLRRGHELLHEV